MEVNNIINAINIVAEKIFKSVEGEVFKGLDNFLIIDETILNKEPLKTLAIKGETKGLVTLVFSFVIFFFIYYIITRTIAMYNGETVENVYKYTLRIIICVICSTSALFLFKEILSINGMLTGVIKNIGEELTKNKICFESLKEVVGNLDKYMSKEAMSIDGVIKGIISFGATSILIAFAVRYVTVIFLIFVGPIAIMFASSSATYGIFKGWSKLFLTNIFLQNIVVIILIIPLAVKPSKDDLFKIILVGSIYLSYKVNGFAKEFLGNITEQIVRRK